MIRILPIALVAAQGLVGCESVQDQATNSYFAKADGTNSFVSDLGDARTLTYQDANGEGFVFQAGTDDDGLAAQAGLLPGTATASWSPTGTGTYSGTYRAIHVGAITVSGNQISGLTVPVSGDITLRANFAGDTISGASDDGDLRVNGKMSGNKMSGTVTYGGVGGELSGLAGADQAFGVFHGNDAENIYAGGFAVERD